MTDVIDSLRTLLTADGYPGMADAGFLLLRLSAGLFLVYFHGWHKLVQGIAHVSRGTAWPLLDDVKLLGLPLPVPGAFAATVTQLIGGLAVAAGFLTRPAAVAVMGSLVVASFANWRAGKDNQLALLYAFLFAGFVLGGGGRFSLDALVFGPGR